MKKILGILLLCTACTTIRTDYTQNCVVKTIRESNGDNRCMYGLKEDKEADISELYAPCGKFNIGDTIILVKK